MVPPRSVETTVVVDPVELAQLVNHAAKVPVLASLIVMADNAVMMGVDTNHADNAPPLKPVKMVSVLELRPLNVQTEFAAQIVLVEVVEAVPMDKDAVQVNANAIMTAMREIVEMQSNQTVPILDFAHKDLVEHVPMVIHVHPMEDALP